MTQIPIFKHTFFGHNSAIFNPIGLNILYGCSGDYYLSTVIQVMMLIFLNTFGRKMSVATTRAHNGPGPPNPTKKLAYYVDLLGQLLS